MFVAFLQSSTSYYCISLKMKDKLMGLTSFRGLEGCLELSDLHDKKDECRVDSPGIFPDLSRSSIY